MRHGDKQNNLGRKKEHRTALLRNLASELIMHKRIVTTLAKAKALRTFVEPLITKTKKNDNEATIMHQHRTVFAYLNDKAAVKELFTEVAAKVAGRPGGYTRIIKLGIRPGDNAERALIELVDFNDVYGKGAKAEEAATKRTRRGGRKATATPSPTASKTEAPAAEAPQTEAPVAEEAAPATPEAPAAEATEEKTEPGA